jgi:hypothetical protein
MKKQSLVFLALAAALAIAPAAQADDTFDFTYSDGTVTGSGTLTSSPGNYQGSQIWLLTGGSGTFYDGVNSGSITLQQNPNYPSSTTVVEADTDYNFAYDDQLSLFNGPNQYLTFNGLYFIFSGTFGNIDLNLYQLGGGPGYDAWFEGNGNGDTAGTFTITSYDISPDENPATPEPGSFLLLGTGLFAMAGLLLRRRMASGLAL